MEKENNTPELPQDDKWLDNILGTATPPAELGPDELAVTAAGLVHMDDMDLEKILSEDWSKVPDLDAVRESPEIAYTQQAEPAPETPAAEPAQESFSPSLDADATQMFFPLEDAPSAPNDATQVIPATEHTAAIPEVTEKTQPIPAQAGKKARPDKGTKPEKAERKTRPAPKKGYGLFGIPHILSTVIWLVIVVIIGVTLGSTLWICTADLMAFGKPDLEATITITEEDDIDSIAQKLAEQGLIEHPGLFKLFAQLTGKDEDIDTGTFTLNAIYDYNAMINRMRNYGPSREEITVTIPEGYTCAQLFALLAEKGVCSVEEVEEYAANGELKEYWFLEGVERGDKYCLEGYLFPDTYNFYTHSSPRQALEKCLDGFDYRFTDKMKEQLDTLNKRLTSVLSSRGYSQSFIDQSKFTYRDIVIIASMIEKETASDAESARIASVIFNRLTNPANFLYLNIDATLIYALNGNVDPETGKVKPLTKADYEMDHPFNTYNEPGLPPGPISNPGRNSLLAALDPEDTGYYYYVYDPEAGEHVFSKTLKEHENATARINSRG